MSEIHNCDDDELDATLHRLLVVEGHDEVVIHHPQDGERVVTQASYLEMKRHLARAKDMSPAERLIESARIKNKKQLQFRTAMIEAEFHKVDLNNDKTFGFDVDGNKLDIEGLIFISEQDYLGGIEKKENEIGAFVDESMTKPPLRILKTADLKEQE